MLFFYRFIQKPESPCNSDLDFGYKPQFSLHDQLSCELSSFQKCELPDDIITSTMSHETVNFFNLPHTYSEFNMLNENPTNNNLDIENVDAYFLDPLSSPKSSNFPENNNTSNSAVNGFSYSQNDDSIIAESNASQLELILVSEESDSCSDFESELHDEKLYEEEHIFLPLQMSNPCFDSEAERFSFPDKVAERLDELISTGVIPEDHIFYKLVDNITRYTLHYSKTHKNDGIKFAWDPVIVNWCNSILYLGGKKSYNFLRGPANFKQGKHSTFDMTRFNLPLPDERTCRRHTTAFTTRPGIIVELLLCIINLLRSRPVTPLVDNNICTVFGMCMSRDGIGLKPELNFDPIRKILVGANFDIDIDYIKNHPIPDTKTLKDAMIKDADTLVLTDLENKVSLPVGLDYSKHSQTGEEVKTLLEKRIEEVQMCTGCIEHSQSTGQVVADANVSCIRYCEICSEQSEVCDQCKREGQTSINPQLRACRNCIDNKVRCSSNCCNT